MKKKYIFIYLFVTFLYWMSLYTYVPILPTYLEKINTNYKYIGLIIGSYGLTQMLLRIPLGILSDKIGKRKPFIFFGLICSLISASILLAGKEADFALISRSFAGFSASSWVVFTILFVSYFDKAHVSKMIGYITATSSLGQLSGTFIGPIFDLEGALVISIITSLTGLILAFIIKENTNIVKTKLTFKKIAQSFKKRDLLVGSILAVFGQFIVFATIYGFTQIHAKNIGATNFQLGLLITLSSIAGIFSSMLSGSFFAIKFGARKTIIQSLFLFSLITFFVPFVKSLFILFIVQIVLGFLRLLFFPLLMTMSIKNISYENRGSAMGFFQAVYGLGMFLGPLITGLFSQLSLIYGFSICAITGFIAVFISYKYTKKIAA